MKDPYEALGVPHSASAEEIRSAFRSIAKQCHPDVNGGRDELTAKFRDAAEAYEVLSNKSRKEQYDAYYTSGETVYGETTNAFEADYIFEAREDAKATEAEIHRMYDTLKRYRSEAVKAFFIGLACIAGGLAITLGSWYYASVHGGSYIITYGLIIAGVIGAFKNIIRSISLTIDMNKVKNEFWDSI